MNTLRLSLVLVLVAACDLDDKCIADCDQQGTGGSSGGDGGSGDDGAPNACQDALDQASDFVANNRTCTTHSDCTTLEAICYQGPFRPCGRVAVSADADLSEWNSAYSVLEGCADACGAPACGAAMRCNTEGLCELDIAGPECLLADDLAQQFIDDNTACQTPADCQLVNAHCYQGDDKACTEVALSVGADVAQWEFLENDLGICGNPCGGPECGPGVDCINDRCQAVFPPPE